MINAEDLNTKEYTYLRNRWIKKYQEYYRYIMKTKDKITFEEYCNKLKEKK